MNYNNENQNNENDNNGNQRLSDYLSDRSSSVPLPGNQLNKVMTRGHQRTRRRQFATGAIGVLAAVGVVGAGSQLSNLQQTEAITAADSSSDPATESGEGSQPGTGDSSLTETFEDLLGDDGTRTVVSPYIKLEARLEEQTDIELFQVTADRPSYWRIASLDTYEEDVWRVSGPFKNEHGELAGVEAGDDDSRSTQTFDIKALSAIWLPAAISPVEIVDSNVDVTWNSDNGSLAVRNDVRDSDGVTYTVVSSVPSFSAIELREADDFVPRDIRERYLSTPDLPTEVVELAEQITEGQATTYEKMIALQNHFREYDYTTDLSERRGDPILQFLREREGFCQQFSGTFALMARSLGVPTRVATGFTWGDPIGETADDQTIYSVTGRHAHAWPEVYFEDHGWVPFEPTPGRGIPGATSYTGVDAQQDGMS